MKKLVIMILVVALALCSFAGCAQDKNELVVYTNAGFPPFEYTDGANVVGVDIDIANYIAEELGMTLSVLNVDFNAVVAGAASKDNTIGLAGISIDEERKLTADFTTPYWEANLGIIYKNGTLTPDADGIVKKDSLSGKKLGVQTGTSGDEAAQEISGAKVMPYDDALVAAQAIGNGCDYVIIDNIVAANIVAKAKNLDLEWANLDSEPEYFALAMKKGNTELMNKINPIIEKLVKEGKIEEWIGKHNVE